MQGQSSDSPHPTTADDDETPACEVDQAVAEAGIMGLLLSEDHHGWTRAEVERELSSTKLAVTDALAALEGAGLVNACGELVVASRAARRMDRLEM